MKQIICISCPQGCAMQVSKKKGQILVSGNNCKLGIKYAIAEMTSPVRTLTSTVKTSFLNFPCLPVRTNGEIPLKKVFDCMKIINKITVKKKCIVGEVIIPNILGLGIDIVSTDHMK